MARRQEIIEKILECSADYEKLARALMEWMPIDYLLEFIVRQEEKEKDDD